MHHFNVTLKPWLTAALVALTLVLAPMASAQQKSVTPAEPDEPQLSQRAQLILADTLRYHPMFDSIAIRYNVIPVGEYASPLLLPLTFFGIEPSSKRVEIAPQPKAALPLSLADEGQFDWLKQAIYADSLRTRTLNRVMAANPLAIVYDYYSLPAAPAKAQFSGNFAPSNIKVQAPTVTADALNVGKPKADKWVTKLTSSVQFSQNYVSDNWYQGGESNVNILGIQQFSLTKFDETKRTEFSLTADLKTGFYTAPSDTMRSFRVNDNLLQINSKYGIQAHKRWYYTASLLFKTQVFNNYKANTDELQTQFLSPAEINLSFGLDYKYSNAKKNLSWSLLLAPAAYNLKYVANIKDIDETSFGLDEGKHTLNQIGSSITNKLSWTITKNIAWTSNLFLFSNYHQVQSDFENVFNFTINRYFSTRISLNLRFDDDTSTDGLFQFKELLSFGFNYVW